MFSSELKKSLLVLSAIMCLSFACGGKTAAATADQNIQAASAAYKGGDFRQAAQLFQAAGDELLKGKNPQGALLLGNAALALYKAEDFQGAADLYEKLLSGKHKLPPEKLEQYHFNLILCLGKLRQSALRIAAIDRMLKAVTKIPPHKLADIYAAQGDAYRSMELYGPAVAAYDKAAHILPRDAPVEHKAKILTALGLCQGNLGDYAAARKNLQAARGLAEETGLDRTIAQADSNLGVLSWEQGEYEEARKYLEAALEREQKNNFLDIETADQNNLGILHKSVGNYAEAMRRVQKGVEIAQKVGDARSEGHAMANRALINRIAGNHKEARADYSEAGKLFTKAGFQEGQAATLLGVGRMAELQDKNYAAALENYLRALEIFNKLEVPRWQATALLLLGDVHKRMTTPGRSTRDLVFDEEPTVPEIPKDEALSRAREYYARCLEMAERQNLRELIWAARQGLGFSEYKAGNLEAALGHYQAAIDLVSSMFLTLEQVEMLGEYMAGKEDLYNEAIEVCAALYKKTGDKKYQDMMLRYSETLKNEIQKASAALVKLEFEDPKKQEMYEKLLALGQAQAKAAKSAPVVRDLPKDASAEQKAQNALERKAASEHKAKAQKLEGDYKKLLAEWEKKYPENKDIFDASAKRVNIADIQKQLKPDQALLQYIIVKESDATPGQLLITVVKKDSAETTSVEVGEKKLYDLVNKEFVVNYIHKGFKKPVTDEKGILLRDPTNGNSPYSGEVNYDDTKGEEYFNKSLAILSELFDYLIKPVEKDLEGIERLYIVPDGFLNQIPFNMLVAGTKDGLPEFLIEKYEISNLRLAFMEALAAKNSGKFKKMLAIANPNNENFPMGFLDGSIGEVASASNVVYSGKNNVESIALEHYVGKMSKPIDISQEVVDEFKNKEILKNKPTEKWLREKLTDKNNKYDVIYFATHGQAHSDTFTKIDSKEVEAKNSVDEVTRKKAQKYIEGMQFRSMKALREKSIPENTPLNGFLYLSNIPGEKVLDENKNPIEGRIDTKQDGLLTIREIMELGKESFPNTQMVLLSACNAAVSLVPFAIGEEYDEATIFDPDNVNDELSKHGLLNGVDQTTFVEAFMKNGVPTVYASFWQLDDRAAKNLMSNFWEIYNNEIQDPVKAYALAQRKYLEEYKNKMKAKNNFVPDLQPYYWAAGAMFGK